jgi:hypothetical protein
MTKVEIEKRGRVAKVHPRLADVLVQRHGYLRRDMQAQLPPSPKREELEADEKKARKQAAKKVADDKRPAEAKDND